MLSLNYHLPMYFTPVNDPKSQRMDAILQSWDSLHVYTFPPLPIIRQMLNNLLVSSGVERTLIALFCVGENGFQTFLSESFLNFFGRVFRTFLGECFLNPLELRLSCDDSTQERSTRTSSFSQVLPHAATCCLGTVKRFAHHFDYCKSDLSALLGCESEMVFGESHSFSCPPLPALHFLK